MSCRKCTCEQCQRVWALYRRQATEALELRKQGVTLPRIAAAVGSSKDIVSKMLKEAEQ